MANNDIDRTQKVRHLGRMSASEFFGGDSMPIPTNLPMATLVDLPPDIVERANRMIAEDKIGSPFTNIPNIPNSQVPTKSIPSNNISITSPLDVDLFQLAVGKDIISNIDNMITHHENSIKELKTYKSKLCMILNIKDTPNER